MLNAIFKLKCKTEKAQFTYVYLTMEVTSAVYHNIVSSLKDTQYKLTKEFGSFDHIGGPYLNVVMHSIKKYAVL